MSIASKYGGGGGSQHTSSSSETSRPPTGDKPPSEPAWSIFSGARGSQQYYQHHHHQGPESEPDMPSREGDQFVSVPLVDFLDLDPRPVFVVDLSTRSYSSSSVSSAPTSPTPQSLHIIYYNKALQDAGNLLDILEGSVPTSPYGQPAWVTYPVFRAWILDHAMRRMYAKKKNTIVYGGMRWTATMVRRRWKVLHGEVYRHPNHLTASYSNIYYSTKAVGSEEKLGKETAEEAKEPEGKLGKLREEAENWSLEPTEAQTMAPFQRSRKDSLKFERRHSLPPAVSAVPLTPGTSTYYRQSSLPVGVRYDWTCTPPPPNLAPHVQLIRDKDWAKTPLGPIELWSPTLKFMCNMVMACPNPAIVFWGPELNMIYNEAYITIAGDKHPGMLGAPPWVCFKEAWKDFEPFLRSCEESGCGAMVENMLLFINRGRGVNEEMYCSFSFTPILENDKIIGWHEVIFETTKQMITERRVSTLLSLSEMLATSQNLKRFWELTLDGLRTNPQDVGFAVLYSVSDLAGDTHSGSSDAAFSRRYELEGSIGVPEGHPAVATRMDVALGRDCYMRYFRAAAESKEPLFLSTTDGSLHEALVLGIGSRAWNEPCDSVVICAIRPTTGHASNRDTALGFLIIGLNSHRPYDDKYRTFIQLLDRQITTSLASVVLLEEETRRGRTIAEQAALDQQKIEEQLQLRTRELEQSELQLQHFADAVPIGIFILEFTPDNMDGNYRYRNEKWFELTGDTLENNASWTSPLWHQMHPDDVERVQECWAKLMEEKTEQSFEFRIPKRASGRSEVDESLQFTWILCVSALRVMARTMPEEVNILSANTRSIARIFSRHRRWLASITCWLRYRYLGHQMG